MTSAFYKNTTTQLFIILVLTFLAYLNIFDNQFVGDDLTLIVNWDFAHHIENLPDVLFKNVFPEGYSRYRPISTAILILNYYFWGQNTFGYHLHGLLVHLLCTLLVYLITKEIIQNSKFKIQNYNSKLKSKKKLITHNSLLITPFITALLFGVHPIHTEAVTFMMASIDSTAFLFYLLSFYLYLKQRNLASIIFAFMAIFTNEMALTLPFVILFYDFVFKKVKSRNRLKIKGYLPFFVPLFVYLIIRFGFLKIFGGHFGYFGGSFYLTMLTMTKALMKYIQELIYPVNLSSYPQVAEGIESYVGTIAPQDKILSQSIFDLDILFNIAIFILLLLVAIKAYKKYPQITFALGFFSITFIPAMNVIPVGNVMQERYAYLPSFGFILFIVHSSWFIVSRLKRHSLIIFVICYLFLVSFYSYQTFNRNKDYQNSLVFWKKLASQVPNNPLINYYLASEYEFSNQDEKAIEYFQKTYALAPNTPDVNFRLGKLYQKKGNFDLAKKYYLRTLDLDPTFASASGVLEKYLEIKDK